MIWDDKAKPRSSTLLGSLASPARFERAAFRLGGERSILLSYGDKYAVVTARKHAARQEELYRSGGMIVNQRGNKRGAAGGNLIPLRAIGAAVRRMVKLREIYAGRVDRAFAEDFDALRIDLVVMSRGDEQRRAVDLV